MIETLVKPMSVAIITDEIDSGRSVAVGFDPKISDIRAAWYQTFCGHSTDSVEKNRQTAAMAERQQLLYHNPFIYDTYGGTDTKPLSEEVNE